MGLGVPDRGGTLGVVVGVELKALGGKFKAPVLRVERILWYLFSVAGGLYLGIERVREA